MRMIHLLVWKVISHLLKLSYPKKFGLINLRITHENHSNIIVTQTFIIRFFADVLWLASSPAEAHIIHATIIIIKHTTNITDTMILDKAQTMVGNALVGFSFASSHIQFQIIGKHVFNLIQLHSALHLSFFVVVCQANPSFVIGSAFQWRPGSMGIGVNSSVLSLAKAVQNDRIITHNHISKYHFNLFIDFSKKK